MLRSLYSGISGLRAHQTMLDVTGNNIANVNTAGFKASSTQFQDTLSQLQQGATGPQAETGGSNPAQIGLGVRVAGVTTNFAQGSSQSTGRATDLMISGDGFFVTSKGGSQLFTRAGAFSPDAANQLVSPDGGILQGWTATNGVINAGGPVGDITLNPNTMVAKATRHGDAGRQPAQRRRRRHQAGPPRQGLRRRRRRAQRDADLHQGREAAGASPLTTTAPPPTAPVTCDRTASPDRRRPLVSRSTASPSTSPRSPATPP